VSPDVLKHVTYFINQSHESSQRSSILCNRGSFNGDSDNESIAPPGQHQSFLTDHNEFKCCWSLYSSARLASNNRDFDLIFLRTMQTEALTGCTRDELIGAPFKNYFTDPARAEAGIKLVLSEKKVTDYELTARARDGKETDVSYNATTFYDRDRTLQGVFAAARDITERKRLDQALQETNVELKRAKFAAEKANLAKSDFLSSMSHELRTPLNAILGFAQLMDSGSPLPTPTQKVSIGQILQAGWYLLDLINEILDLALIESGNLSLSLEPISLSEVLFDCQTMIEPQAQKSGIHMIFPQTDCPYFVLADRTRVKQILINLLSNAIKYNRENGSVEVTCSANTADRIRISIRDTGDGLSSEKLAQLFQPFNRLGQEAGAEEGTGIGLVVSKRLVELIGGKSERKAASASAVCSGLN
jgi:PAS domain S-box-containing protein